MRLLILFLLSPLMINAQTQIDTSGPVDTRLIQTVVQIKNDSGSGTGFLVSAGERIFLVTNKHMLGEWSPVDPFILYDSILVTFYTFDQSQPKTTIRILLKRSNKELPKVLLHPKQKIDIGIVDITNENISNKISNNYIDTSLLMTMKTAATFMTYGSHVFTIGYPAGIKSFKTNEPIVKSGFLASSMDEKLVVAQSWSSRSGRIKTALSDGKIFLIDGFIIPGNSGGPVVSSQSVEWRVINNTLKHLTNPKNYVLGIVSNSFSSTGITTVFSAEHILELINTYK